MSREVSVINWTTRIVGAMTLLSLIVLSQPVTAGCDMLYQPVKTFNPEYPRRAQERRIEGFVELTYTLSAQGKVEDITIVDAHPKGVFDRYAIRALQNFVFEPCADQGEFVEIRGMHKKFSFALSEN